MLHVINRFVCVEGKGTSEPTFTATVQSTCEPTWKHVQQGMGRDRAEIVQTKAAADLYVTIIHSESDDDTSVCEDIESL